MPHRPLFSTEHTRTLRGDSIAGSRITPETVYLARRQYLKKLALGTASVTVGGLSLRSAAGDEVSMLPALAFTPGTIFRTNPGEELTSYKDATSYNNFYEFGLNKSDPHEAAQAMQTRPWVVKVGGLVKNPKDFAIEDLLKLAPMQERIYSLRCVEGWSMVIPWIGYPLTDLIKQVQPLGSAKYVEFVTLDDPKVMPGLRSTVLHWPYTEALRLDEALNPLTLLTFGMYGKVLPKQNGAPVRLIVPWKYGFKSPKSLVAIRFTENQPATAWNDVAPQEYGFYSNVNPNVDHPRWSQANERPIGSAGLFSRKRPTKLFNGYEAQVGQLYAGMDLKRDF